jgi:tellurite resistance-related uncharacterized protein
MPRKSTCIDTSNGLVRQAAGREEPINSVDFLPRRAGAPQSDSPLGTDWLVTVQRQITGFRRDAVGDWVAELACHHGQHVRHRPPLLPQPWVETPQGRAQHVGTELHCPLCDRAELPEGLEVVRTAGPFDELTLPAGLRRQHRVADATWGMLRVVSGTAHFSMETDPPIIVDLCAGDEQPIPPGVLHSVAIRIGRVEVDFLVPAGCVATDRQPAR